MERGAKEPRLVVREGLGGEPLEALRLGSDGSFRNV